MSLEKVAHHLGVTHQQIRKYETGDDRLTATALFRLGPVLQCRLEEFFQKPGFESGTGDPWHFASLEDRLVARALGRIEDAQLREAVCLLIDAIQAAKVRYEVHAAAHSARSEGDE